MIEYSIRDGSNIYNNNKSEYIVDVKLIDGKLPTEEQMDEVAKEVKSKDKNKLVFILFYLPDMIESNGAFATANYLPEYEGVDIKWAAIYCSKYSHFVE